MSTREPRLADPDAERALIGSILLRPASADECGTLTGLEFADEELGLAFDALRKMRDAGVAQDIGVQLLGLRTAGVASSVTDPQEVRRLMSAAGSGGLAGYHAGIIRRFAEIRRQRAIAERWLDALGDPQTDPRQLAERIDAELAAAAARHDSHVREFDAVAAEVVADLRRRRESPGAVGAVSGLPRVDAAVGGWHAGELVILAARPGQGKTALAMQATLHNAIRGRRVLYASLEMRDMELVTRVLCSESNVNGRLLRSGTFNDDDIRDLDQARESLGAPPIAVYDPPSATVERIRAVARLEHSRRPLALLVLDYLQLLRPTDPRRQRYEQVGEQTAALKALAKEIGCPVLCLAQLSRQAESDEPRLSHLRESGSIEQDADIVLALSRSEGDEATLSVLKHRHGEIGTLRLRWCGTETRFEDFDAAPEADPSLAAWNQEWNQETAR